MTGVAPELALEFVFHAPRHSPRVIAITRDPISVGRSPENTVPFPEDTGLSRKHFVLELGAIGVGVRDLGSKNGTYVNSQRVAGVQTVRPGDRVTAGHVVVDCRAKSAAMAATVVFVDRESTANTSVISTNLRGALQSGDAQGVRSSKAMDALIRAGQELAGYKPLQELFTTVLRLAVESVSASRGVLMTLEGSERKELVTRAAEGQLIQISKAVRDRVMLRGESLLIEDALLDGDLAGRQSILIQSVRSMMAVPLQIDSSVLGLLYVDRTSLTSGFTKDDLNLLTVMANVAAIRIEHAFLLEREEKQRSYERELAQAAEIQATLLPEKAPSIPGFDVAGKNIPCRTVGGDYFDYIPYPGGRLGLVVADVAGKGMPAALMMSALQAYTRVLAEAGLAPGDVVRRLNEHVAARCPAGRFVTLFFALLDPETGAIEYSCAGHNPPMIVRASGDVESLSEGGIVLGVMRGIAFPSGNAKLEPGDSLVLYSDGVTEACRPDSEDEFGEERVAETVRKCDSAAGAVSLLMEVLRQWNGSGLFADDVTVVVARR